MTARRRAADEVDSILATLNGALDVDVTRDDIVGTYAGLRPLVAPSDASSTVSVSREHRVAVERPGLVRISGGKYTTYRVMAADAVDAVLGDAAREPPVGDGGAATGRRRHREPTSTRWSRDWRASRAWTRRLARSLVDRHGTDATAVLELGRELDLVRPLVAGHPYLEAEIAWAAERELALSLDDLLARRIRLAPALRDRGEAIAPRVADIAGRVLGWDAARRADEVATYLAGAHREFDVPLPA